jgi:hypothetical protein
MMDESQYGSGPIAPNTPCFGDRAASRRLRGSDTQLPVALVRGEVVRLLHRQGPGGQALAYVYFEEEPGRRAAAHL